MILIKLKLLERTNILGMALYPFILVRPNASDITINHEKIHIAQQKEMLIIGFYIFYMIDYIIKLFKYGKSAYMELVFEREAYRKEEDLEYLNKRKPFNWLFNN